MNQPSSQVFRAVFPNYGTHTIGGTPRNLKRFAAEDKSLKPVRWLAFNKETKSSYQHGTASPSLS
jgi:hypothetical protein